MSHEEVIYSYVVSWLFHVYNRRTGSITHTHIYCPLQISFNEEFITNVFLFLEKVIEFDDGSGSVLRIQPLRVLRDEAIYECMATNSVGEINTSAKLTVLEGRWESI